MWCFLVHCLLRSILTHRFASPPSPPQMLANTPNGKVSEALAQIYTKEGVSLSKPKGGGKGKAGSAGADGGAGGEGGGMGEEEEELTPVVYVAKARERRAESDRERGREGERAERWLLFTLTQQLLADYHIFSRLGRTGDKQKASLRTGSGLCVDEFFGAVLFPLLAGHEAPQPQARRPCPPGHQAGRRGRERPRHSHNAHAAPLRQVNKAYHTHQGCPSPTVVWFHIS